MRVIRLTSSPKVIFAHFSCALARCGVRRAERIGACASPPWPEVWAAPASSADCSTTSMAAPLPIPATLLPASPSSATPVTTSPSSGCGSAPTSTRSSTRSVAACTKARAGGGPTRPARSQTSSRAWARTPQWFTLGDKDIATHVYRIAAAGTRYAAQRGRRTPLHPLGAARSRRHAAAHDRHPGRDPRRRRGGRGSARHPLPGVVGPSPGRPPGRPLRRRRSRPGDGRTRRARGDPRGRRRPAAPEQPGRVDRHHPRRAGGARRAARHPGAGRRRVAARRRAPGPRPRRRLPARDRGRGDERRRRGPLRGLPRRVARRRARPHAGSSTRRDARVSRSSTGRCS